MAGEITVRTLGGEILDAIVYDRYGKTSGCLEAVLTANPGLADQGLILPAGVDILLPDLGTDKGEASLVEFIKLWD